MIMNRRSFLKASLSALAAACITCDATAVFAQVKPGIGPATEIYSTEIPRSLDRMNIRRFLLIINDQIEAIVKGNYIGEFNDKITRASLEKMLMEYGKNLKKRDACTDINFTCNDANNPPSLVDRNAICVSTYLQFRHGQEFVGMDTVVSYRGAEFSELT